MESNIEQAIMVLYGLLNGKSSSHENILDMIKNGVMCLPQFKMLSKPDIELIAYQYEIQYGSKTFEPGITLTSKEADDSWFYKKKKQLSGVNHPFQERYENYLLLNHYGEEAKESIISEAERVLSFCADPESNERKRGLVMGDVQSGKTSNYLALANIAFDYGYKIILILAGLTDSLRIQTQERTDEGVVGAISSTIGNSDSIKYVGVGRLGDGGYYAVPFTTDTSDFTSPNCTPSDLSKPQILVVKKNKSVLTNVKKWLKPGQASISSHNILIIDDECDNASVNTKKDDDPSTINGLIRDIYNNFDCSTYVGYTATPFANIFINPDKQSGYDDLFPNDFIHRLKTSNESYFGIDKVFRDYQHIKILDENEDSFLPSKHKKDDEIIALSEPLKNAICSFLIANCVRTKRGHTTKHRSMMINISPFNNIQNQLYDLVENYINSLVDIISQYDKYDIERFRKHKELERIYCLYLNDELYSRKNAKTGISIQEEVPFEEIKNLLFEEVSKVKVAVINNKYKGDQRFKYKDYKETGARVIAIGGFVLSRGLTLEGLMISYYNRNSMAYDTLLQMCRWFGYRPGYEDLCSVYMKQINYDCFCAVVEALDNLDSQLSVMKAQGATPKDFGLMIEESPDTLETDLLITARNKMKNSVEIIRGLNYSGVAIDTSKIYSDVKRSEVNNNNVKSLYNILTGRGYKVQILNNEKRHMFKDVSNDIIAAFVEKFEIPLENKKFDRESVAEFIRKGEYYSKWDIVFATGNEIDNEEPYRLGKDIEIPPVHRSFAKESDEEIIRIAKNNNRLLDPGIFNSGLTDDQIELAKEIAKERVKNSLTKKDFTPIAKDYLSVPNRNPLLVILPIKLKEEKNQTDEQKNMVETFKDSFLIGIGIGFAGSESKVMMKFRINKIKQQEYINKYIEDEEVEYE